MERNGDLSSGTKAAIKVSAEIRPFVEKVDAGLKLGGVEERTRFWIQLVLEEAIVNALKHGNSGDGSKTVRVHVSVDAHTFTASVEDEGDPFDPATVPDPRAPENIEKPSGRGLLLIREYMTAVEWYEREIGGKGIRMVKNLEEPQDTAPVEHT